MLVLDSTQILDAVKRSLQAHVLPNLADEYARVQVAAIFKLLDEVNDRLRHGDPMLALNAAIANDASALADRLRASDGTLAAAIDAALAIPAGSDPRQHNRALVDALWPLARDPASPGSQALLKLLFDRANEFAQRDAAWLCPESLLSLI